MDTDKGAVEWGSDLSAGPLQLWSSLESPGELAPLPELMKLLSTVQHQEFLRFPQVILMYSHTREIPLQ